MRTRCLLVLLLMGVLAGCGNQGLTPSDVPKAAGSAPSTPITITPGAPMPTQVPAASGIVTTTGAVTVIQHGDSAPEMCLGAVLTSLPPQCGGTELRGFEWPKGKEYAGRAGVRFGAFTLTGRFDGTSMTVLSADPLSTDDPRPPTETPDFSTPCPQPEGGWRVVDPQLTNDSTVEEAFSMARKLPGYANSWIDRSRIPKNLPDDSPLQNDPERITVNVEVVSDVEGADVALRKVWGGALCVSKAVHTEHQLGQVQGEVQGLPGMLLSDSGFEHVNVTVVYDDGSLQAWVDMKFGPGLVRITSALRPVLG